MQFFINRQLKRLKFAKIVLKITFFAIKIADGRARMQKFTLKTAFLG